MSTKTPFKSGQRVTLSYAVAGFTIGEYTVGSVSNTGTKRNPVWRVYLAGAGYVDAGLLEQVT